MNSRAESNVGNFDMSLSDALRPDGLSVVKYAAAEIVLA